MAPSYCRNHSSRPNHVAIPPPVYPATVTPLQRGGTVLSPISQGLNLLYLLLAQLIIKVSYYGEMLKSGSFKVTPGTDLFQVSARIQHATKIVMQTSRLCIGLHGHWWQFGACILRQIESAYQTSLTADTIHH